MQVSFESKSVTLQPAVVMQASSFELLRIEDNTVDKVVKAKIKIANRILEKVLWQDEAYDEAGDWTQEEANNRIIELL